MSLSEFAIIYSPEDHDYSLRAAQYIQDQIWERTGLALPLVKDTEISTTKYEIVVGETSREISQRLIPPARSTQFVILAEQNRIALEGEYFVIAAAAYYFIETYVPADDYSADIPMGMTVHNPIVEKADNFIFLIGDGMGVNQTRLPEFLKNDIAYGDQEDIFYGYYFPYQGYSRTDSLSGTTDSAAGGTALACGIKTINGYIGQDKDHKAVQSLTELAGSLGKATAVMSTEAHTGATPCSFSAHADDRTLIKPILETQGKLKEQYGTIINCGYDYYTSEDVEWIQKNMNATLNQLDDNQNGFFLMYEEAHIDKHCHNNNLELTFQAVIRFNQVIAVVMEYAFYHPNTFVLITADHETGGLTQSGDGFKYTVTYHSSADVPVFVYGTDGEVFNGKTIENIQIPQTIAYLWGNENFGDHTSFKPLQK